MARILLLEPDKLLVLIYREMLEARGHGVRTSATAQGGVSLADRNTPDLVIVELQLINHSGVEFLYEFRSYADWLGVPIIIQTHVPPGEFGSSRDILMLELNIAAYLYKPHTNLHQLARTVDETLAKQSTYA